MRNQYAANRLGVLQIVFLLIVTITMTTSVRGQPLTAPTVVSEPAVVEAERAKPAKATPARKFSRSYFLRKLTAKDPATRFAAADRIRDEYGGTDEAVETVLTALDSTTRNEHRIDASVDLVALLRYFEQKTAIARLEQLLDDNDLRIVMTAMDSLKYLNRTSTLPKILALAERPEFESVYGFRAAILNAVMSFRTTAAVDFVIARLPELDGQSEKYALQYLSEISRRPFSRDKSLWIEWWAKTDRQAFIFNEEPLPQLMRATADESGPQFFGVQIDAKRFVFVIDKSGSMSTALNFRDMQREQEGSSSYGVDAEEKEEVETRLLRAKKELESAIDNLPSQSYFNIVAFNGRLKAWQRELVPARAEFKLGASGFVQSLEADGETAWYDALDATIGMDANLESIFFLSDGMPTVGRIVSATRILDAMKKKNRFRHVSIHTVGLGVNRTADHFLRELARMSGGEYRSLGEGEAAIVEKMRMRPDADSFAPRRVIKRPMPPVTKLNIIAAKSANRRIKPDELVLGVVVNNEARAYPLNGLTGPNREIFNDTLGGTAIAATW